MLLLLLLLLLLLGICVKPPPHRLLPPVCQVVGDDLLVTNPVRVAKAIAEKSCNALLLKVWLCLRTLRITLYCVFVAMGGGQGRW